MTDQAHVFIVDDDASVRKGLMRLLKSAGYTVETFASANEFLERPAYNGIGCLILDLRMPGLDGIELQQQLDSSDCNLPVIFLSGHAGVSDSVKAMKCGASDFLTKPVDGGVLLSAVNAALDTHRDQLNKQSEVSVIQKRFDNLTARELETARWLITGMLNKQIADKLGIAEKTVKVHRSNVMQKMEISSVAELVRLCAMADINPMTTRE